MTDTMLFTITEQADAQSFRRGEQVYVKDLPAAKRRASKMQLFQGTVLIIEDAAGVLAAVKKQNGRWVNIFDDNGV